MFKKKKKNERHLLMRELHYTPRGMDKMNFRIRRWKLDVKYAMISNLEGNVMTEELFVSIACIGK